jgi:secreted trypsin-like serine protease
LDGVVRLDKNGQPQCTGTLLTTGRHILTAAHCLDGLSNIDVVFEMPPDPSADVVQNVPSSGFMVHPNWNGNLQDGSDIAILELPNAAPPR